MSQVTQSCACVSMSKLIHAGMRNTKGRGDEVECSYSLFFFSCLMKN